MTKPLEAAQTQDEVRAYLVELVDSGPSWQNLDDVVNRAAAIARREPFKEVRTVIRKHGINGKITAVLMDTALEKMDYGGNSNLDFLMNLQGEQINQGKTK